MRLSFSNKKLLIISIIGLVTFICFRYTLHNQFTIWDDDYYVTNDPYIKAFTWDNLKIIFTTDITKNNYHPLCMLSLAINYYFAQLNPETYYLTNILIHIANVILLFVFVIRLMAALKIEENGQLFIAAVCAALFGIHPMHVESVAWIAERKDVLYAFFYLWGLITYLKYLSTGKWKWYWITFLLFIASCLSKPMAVVFPLSLFCIDFLLRRKWSKILVTEKIIFFVGSLICGIMAIYTQDRTGAIAAFGAVPFHERILYASYGFMMYIAKLFDPSRLSTFYPYPYKMLSGYLPGIYYAAPFIAVAIMAVPLYLAYKCKRAYFRIVAFGLGFFTANVIFILQFISCGAAIMADRYSYVAYIGLFFMIAYFLWELIRIFPSVKTIVIGIVLLSCGILSYQCYERTYVWHDSETLLTDAIDKYPMQALLSYKWRGNYYLGIGDMDKAMEDYNVLVTLNSADARTYNNIGKVFSEKKDYPKAIAAYTTAIKLQPDRYRAFADRAAAYAVTGDVQKAMADYVNAYQINQDAEKVMADDAFNSIKEQQFPAALNQYNMLLAFSTTNPFYYFYHGVALFNTGKIPQAVADWQIALKFNSSDVLKSASYNLCVAYDTLGDPAKAVYYANMAQKAGYAVNPDYMAKLKGKAAHNR